MFKNWTWQQKKKFETFHKLKRLFLDPRKGKPEPRTWRELSKAIPKGTLSPLLNKWITEGIVEPKLEIDKNGKRKTFYVLKKTPVFKVIHKIRKTGPVERIFISPKGEIEKRDYGRFVSSGKGSIYFRKAKRT